MKEGKVFKRILAIALVVVMTITMMPFGVFANGTEGTVDATEAPHAHAWVNGVCECGVACDHADKVRTDEKKATCIATGHKSYFTCNTCGSIIRAGEITTLEYIAYAIDPNNHASTETILKDSSAVDASCTTDGKAADLVYKCCEAIKTTGATIPASHTLVHHNAQAATCVNVGWEAYDTCSKCDYTTKVEIPALDHDKVPHDGQAATCTEKGWKAYETCSRCEYTTYEEIPALTHDYDNWETVSEPTCTEKGSKKRVCKNDAAHILEADIDPIGHSWLNGKCIRLNCGFECAHDFENGVCKICGTGCTHAVGTPATCKTKAICAGCGLEIGEVDPDNHLSETTKTVGAITATCTTAGKEADVVYACCEAVKTEGAVIPALGHTGGTAKCNAKAVCTRCNEEYGERDATNHASNETEVKDAVEATCTAKGYTGNVVHKCCNVIKTTGTDIEKLAHSYTVEVTASKVAATCSTKGSVDMKCATCDAKENIELDIDATNHEGYTTEVPGSKKEPTCVTKGEVEMKCACGATEKKVLNEVATAHNLEGVSITKKDTDKHGKKCANEGCTAWVDVTDHAYNEVVENKLPTCVTKGSKTTKCVCGDTKIETLNENDNHDWGEWKETLAPTCTVEGSKERTCKRPNCTGKEVKEIPATGHTMTKTEAVAATCMDAGNIEFYTCSVCSKNFEDEAGKIEVAKADTVIPATADHKFTKYVVVKDATCTDNAVEKATCDVCKKATHEKIITDTMLAHTFKNYKSDENATCKVDGTMTAVCEMCKEAKDTKTDVDSHKNAPHTPDAKAEKCTLCGADLVCRHTYSAEKLITKTATCTTEGQKAIVCSKCHANKPGSEEVVPAKGHAWGEGEITKTATCKNTGSMRYTCNNMCGETKTEEIPVAEHTYKEEITHATCTEDGYSTFTCTVCGSHYVDNAVKAYGHMFDTYFHDEGSATCYKDGTKTAECANGCGTKNTLDDPNTKTDHEMTDFTVITPATCTEDGEEEAKCFYFEHCGYSEIVPVYALGHDESAEFVESKAATCTEKGEKTKTCARCPEIVATEEIPALGHDETAEFVVVKEATCTEKGEKTKTCTRCPEIVAKEEIPALGHDIAADYTIDVAATCTTEGSQSKHCSRCDYKDGVVAIPASGHNMQPGEGTTATCTEPGKAVFVCANGCGKVNEEANVPALGHDFAYVSDGNATCQADGTKTGKCIRCEETDTIADTGSMLDHTFGEPVIDKASEEKGGLVTTKCANCDYEEVEEIAMIDGFKLKYETVVYDGKYKRPSLTITDAEGAKLVKGEDYLLELPAKEDCVNAGTYTYKVTFIGNYEGEKELTYKIVPGKAAKIVSKDTKQTYITLKWSTVKGADGYRIYVQNSKGGWKKLATVKGTTTYKVKDLKAGTKYTFAVKAFMKGEDGETTIWADEFAQQTFKTLPGKTSKLTAKTSKNAVKLTWKAVTGAEGYRVYVKTAKGGWKTVATVKGGKVTYTVKNLKPNTTYEYAVKAFYKDGSATVWSNQYKTVKAKTAAK